MSKRKKIFHKPDEQIPSADDILNYLNEENSPLPPSAEKSSPSGGAFKKRSSNKPELDGLAKDEFLSESKKEKKKEEEEQDMPAPSFGGLVQEPVINYGQTNRGNAEKNKKKYELEKKMLAEPLVSEAVEGYALIRDKEKAKNILAEINESIASQTGRKNNRGVFLRIAAILVLLFLVSGGSFYLFEQFSSSNMEAVSNKASTAPAVALDTVRQAVIDSAVKQEQLAIETDKTFATQDKRLQPSKPVSSDAYPDQSPIMEEPGNTHGNGYGNPAPSMQMEEERIFSQSNTPVNYNADSVTIIPNDELAVVADDAKEESKLDVVIERNRKQGPKDKKVAARSNQQYAPSSAKLSEVNEDQSTGMVKKTYLLEDGIRLYNEGKFKEAKEIFTGLLITQPSNQEAIFYSGMSDYKMQLYDRALGNLTKVVPASRRYDEARWTSSLIYLEMGRREEAIELWKMLSKFNNSYSEKAFEKLKEYSK
ncbi:MAG TPA: hypothetical protein VNB90_15265 [Cytophagaceae bacterium]|nr:hypothetical protein [Cytophagaceae bacterium]